MGLKENIKKYRLQNNLTLEDVAKVVGVTPQTIQKYEKGTILNVPQDNIEKMAKIFNVSPARLVGWDNAKKIINQLDQNIDNLEKVLFADENELNNFKTFQAEYLEYMDKLSHDEYIQYLTNNKNIKEIELLSKFRILNEQGQDKAIENVTLLNKVPEYKKQEIKKERSNK